MGKRVRKLRCPTCKQPVLRAQAEFPFCSERCRLIDLGKWASGAYVVSTPAFDPDADSQIDMGDLPRARPAEGSPPSPDDD